MSVRQLSRKSGVGVRTIYAIEAGHSPSPKVDTIVRLARALQTTVTTLMGWRP